MSEIWNLSTLCRCCHADGYFKSLNLSYQGKTGIEIYDIMLRDTLGISISAPPLEVSYTICDKCILKLRDATSFKSQVLRCEEKFKVYCTNEEFLSVQDSVKLEVERDNDDSNIDVEFEQDDNLPTDDKTVLDIKQDDDSQMDENVSVDVKKEYSIEVDIKHPIKELKEDEPQLTEKNIVSKKNVKTIRKRIRNTNIKKEKPQKRLDRSLIIEVDTENGVQYSCKNCGGCYKTKKEMSNHIYKQHAVPFKCEYCSKQLKTVTGYKRHLNMHTSKKLQCPHCPKRFACDHAFSDHVNSHTRERVFKCDICAKDFKYKQTLRKHLRLHYGTNKKKLCDLCGHSFNDRTNLEIHIRVVHEKQRPFSCNCCGKNYSTKKHLINHLRLHEGGKKYQCDICDHRLSCAKTMKIHRLKHDNKFMCKHCLAIFDDQKIRRDHIKTMHHQTHTCELCGKFFSSKHSLNRHTDDHNGIKRFPCEICDFKFSQKSMLTRHIFRKHNPNTDFEANKTKCDICKRSFKNIIVHMDSHVNRKSACEICGKTYPDNRALNRHRLQKHFGRTYDCDICGKKYQQKAKLNTHKLKVHKIKIEKVSSDGS